MGNGAPHLLLTGVAQKFTFGELELQIAVASLFVDMTEDIPFHITLTLPEARRSWRYLQGLNGLFTLCPHLPHL